VKAYWTEAGNGAEPEPGIDVVGGNIVVEIAPNTASFTVTYEGSHVDTYTLTGAGTSLPSATSPAAKTAKYAWSKNSNFYHHANCRFVQNIAPANLEQGDTPPRDKTPHKECPR
jgi:hypothetical protein